MNRRALAWLVGVLAVLAVLAGVAYLGQRAGQTRTRDPSCPASGTS